MTQKEEFYYRFDDRLVSAGVDEFDNPLGPPQVHIYVSKLRVLKHTPKGVWLDLGFGDRRFVLDAARRKYACPSFEEARTSFNARKARQVKLLQIQIAHVMRATELAASLSETSTTSERIFV